MTKKITTPLKKKTEIPFSDQVNVDRAQIKTLGEAAKRQSTSSKKNAKRLEGLRGLAAHGNNK